MTLAGLALRSLAAWRARSIAAMAGIMISVASLVALVGLARGIESSLMSSIETRGTDVVITEAGALDLMSSLVPEGLADEVATFPLVAAATPELSRLTALDDGRTVMTVSWPAAGFPWKTLHLIRGDLPKPGDTRVAVIGEGLASRLGTSLGDRLFLSQTGFEVIGIVGSQGVINRNLVFLLLSDSQAVTYRQGQATAISVDLRNTDLDADAAVAALQQSLPGYLVQSTGTLAQEFTYGRIASVISLSISAVALLSAILIIFNTMAMAVSERINEIAILAAVGWTRARIIGLILIEGVMISVCAGLLGCGLGSLAAYEVAQSAAVMGLVMPEISLALLGEAMCLSVLVGIVGSLAPALSVSRRSPAAILREH